MERLFNGKSLSEYISDVEDSLNKEVNNYTIEELTNDVIVDGLLETYTINPLKLLPPKPYAPIETTQLRDTGYGEKYHHKGYEIKVEVPFEGDWQLFNCRPSPYVMNYAEIDRLTPPQRKIYFTLFLDELNKAIYENRVWGKIKDISENIPNVNNQVSGWNSALKWKIANLVEQRKTALNHKHNFMKEIGLEVNPASSSHMIPPIKQKKIPVPVPDTTKKVASAAIPALQQEIYKDIVEVIYNVGKAIERKPSLYLGKGEDGLRDILLLFLETRYEATAGTSETFNKKGKTDILLKYAGDGSNIFVAECKIWAGQKKYHQAIDQLLGYLTHRDSKTALIIFVDQQNFMTIIQTVKEQTATHPKYKKQVQDRYDTSFPYIFSLPGDSNKEIQVEVILFHFPKH